MEGVYDLSEYNLPRSSKCTVEEAIDLSQCLVSQVEGIKKYIKKRNLEESKTEYTRMQPRLLRRLGFYENPNTRH